ncbi:MAG: ABC transporter ATP-binding protein [Spirochaetia bacterium]|nr:ABC transporter ATP-binding protein [Spirochaetia bacterium]
MKFNSTNNLICLKNLSFSYGKKNILNDININISQGRLISIVGKSGSGKSTLLYLLGGFLKPQSGEYLLKNKPVYKTGEIGLGNFRKNNIGFVFQDFRLMPHLTVEENIYFPSYFTGKNIKKESVINLMKEMNIYHRKKAFPKDISGGEAQRTALCRALLLKPPILLLDEPTGNLDEITEKEILSILLKLRKQNYTLICITHSSAVKEKSDVIYKLENQNLIQINKKAKLK